MERHLREGEERIARQIALVEALELQGRGHEAAVARGMLTTFELVREVARGYRHLERRKRGLKP